MESADIEPAARVPFARVHFDIRRQDGIERAVKVTLRRGSRVSPQQHRFGDLAGAHHADEKGHHPLTDDHPGSDWSFEGHPVELIEEWAHLVNCGELWTLRLLYAPEAVLHVGPEQVLGRDAVINRLRDEFSGPAPQASGVHDRDHVISVEVSVGDRNLCLDFKVAHGRVVEQWM